MEKTNRKILIIFLIVLLIVCILSIFALLSYQFKNRIDSFNDATNSIKLNSSDNYKPSILNNGEKLKVEIGELGNEGTVLRVINRNDYDWHNVEITIDEYYMCWSTDVLGPNEIITINSANCNDFIVNHRYVSTLTVKTDEGEEYFTR